MECHISDQDFQPQTKYNQHLFEGVGKAPRYLILLGAIFPKEGKSKEVSLDLWYRTPFRDPSPKGTANMSTLPLKPECCHHPHFLALAVFVPRFYPLKTLQSIPSSTSPTMLPRQGLTISSTFQYSIPFGLRASRLTSQGVQPPPATRIILLKHKSNHVAPLLGLAQVTPRNVTCAAQ